MRRRRDEVEVVYVEREGASSAKSLIWGMLIGATLALLYAPRSGEETRRALQRRLRKLRAMAEEKVDELGERFGRRGGTGASDAGDDDALEGDDDPGPSARDELERRLSEARARRRRAASIEDDEPLG
ncbi:MAG TPA: YtxH domain-containing protein [Gemmatimonadales bacterium]|nr:YtxH domain-containing protein [Gemmatimonadales bacterium]